MERETNLYHRALQISQFLRDNFPKPALRISAVAERIAALLHDFRINLWATVQNNSKILKAQPKERESKCVSEHNLQDGRHR